MCRSCRESGGPEWNSAALFAISSADIAEHKLDSPSIRKAKASTGMPLKVKGIRP